MPISKVGLVRTDGQANAPKGRLPFVPFYTVLFWYGKDTDFVNTPSGTLNYEYYRQYSEIYYPVAIYYKPDGSISKLQSNPIIACISTDNGWNSNTGLCLEATTNLPNTAATLYETNSHNPATLGRTKIYNALGYKNGDVQSETAYYIEQNGTVTHNHTANNVAEGLRSVVFGVPDDNNIMTGLDAIAVDPILRDPRLTTIYTGYNDTKLTFLPKNVIVFGSNLVANAALTNYYTRVDSNHISSANGKVLPLIARDENDGVLGLTNSISFTIPTNTVLNHNHNVFPEFRTYKSNKGNQTSLQVVEAGSHSHQVTYSANVTLRSKIMRAWITTNDSTPIANGIILAYSIGKNTLYQGLSANSKGLPVNWHFCDGTNGTPDLRGYYIYANFDTANTYHDVVINSSNTMSVYSISMQANGNHSHLGPLTGQEVGTGVAVDIGSHTFEDVLDHTHTISSAVNFKINPGDTANAVNIKVGQTYSYTPPTVQLAFIMYNNIIT